MISKARNATTWGPKDRKPGWGLGDGAASLHQLESQGSTVSSASWVRGRIPDADSDILIAQSGFAHGRPQAWARERGALAPSKCCKVFCALVFTVKRSVDRLFMHYFHNFSSASAGLAPRPPPGLYPGPRWGTFVSRPPNLPPGKKSCGRPWLLLLYS